METNGAVRAIVGGRDYGASQFNRATMAERQVGSSFKPYVYAAAMEAGMTPETVVSDGPVYWGNWAPKNYGRSFSGRVTLASALARSINTVPVRLAKDKLGIDPIVKLTYAMGVESKLNEHKTMVLGTSGMTVMDQATGYNTMADGGYAGVRFGITQLRTRSGDVFYDHNRDAPPPRRVLSEQSVAYMNTMLAGVNEAGTGRRAAMPLIRSAGKTGTTQSYRDAWYVGYTGNYTAAVWLGNDDFTPSREMTGGSLPAMTWNRLMTHIHQNIDLKPIPGLENPFVDPKIIAKAQEDAAKTRTADALPAPDLDAPRVLSSDTARVLRKMTDMLSKAEPLEAPAPAALTAL
jgi:penicillin-binding protein 1A